MSDICMVQGDTGPARNFTLVDGAGDPVQIGDGLVTLRLKGLDRAYDVDRAAPVITPSAGVVQYVPEAADTAEPGLIRLEFLLTYDDGSLETFPVEGAYWMEVRPRA